MAGRTTRCLQAAPISSSDGALGGHADPSKVLHPLWEGLSLSSGSRPQTSATTVYVDWQLSLVSELLAGEEPDLTKVRRAISSLALGLNSIQMDAMKTVANFSLRRRDADLTRLPPGTSEEVRAALRSSPLLDPLLFEEGAVAEVRAFAERQTQLQILSLRQPVVRPKVAQPGKRQSQVQAHQQKRPRLTAPPRGRAQAQRGGNRPSFPAPPQAQAQRQPFRGGASGRRARGRGRGR